MREITIPNVCSHMKTIYRFRRIASIVSCGVALATVTAFAQLSIGLKPGPWDLRDGVGDPRPDIGPVVHVPFDDIQRRYRQIEPGQLDLGKERQRRL